MGYWIGIGVASIIFSGLFAILAGLLFQNNPTEDGWQEIPDSDQFPQPLPVQSPAADFSPAAGRPVVADLRDGATIPVSLLHSSSDTAEA